MDCILPMECMKVKVAQSCLTFCDPMDYTDHAILQIRILEWVAFPFSKGSSQPRDETQVSCVAGGFFTNWAIGEVDSSVQFSFSVMSDSLWLYGLQHGRLPCPTPAPGACSKSCPLSQWCHPTISSSVLPFSRLQSFPASGSFPRTQFFTSGGQSFGVSASSSVLPMNTQDWSPLGWTGWISLQSKGLSRVLQHHNSNPSILHRSAFFIIQL